jgi:hypothetical protein
MPEDYPIQQNVHRSRDLSKFVRLNIAIGQGYLLLYSTKFPVCATRAGGQKPTLYLNALNSNGASFLALVYIDLNPLGFWKYIYTDETKDLVR